MVIVFGILLVVCSDIVSGYSQIQMEILPSLIHDLSVGILVILITLKVLNKRIMEAKIPVKKN
jgi:hypothetical protein